MNENKWAADLPAKWAGKVLEYGEELESTNQTAACLGRSGGVHGTLVVADKQTGGRGRRGRSWESPAGKNLYFSLLLKPKMPIEKISMLTLVMAHSVAKAIEKMVDVQVGIKWPNDILISGKKVCGILTEMNLDGANVSHVIVGVGVNVHDQEFSEELQDKATSLEKECGTVPEREKLLACIMEIFEEDYECFAESGDLQPFTEYYHSRLLNKDAAVKVLDPQEPFEGIARGITATGELLVEDFGGKIHQVYAGEVSVRGALGYV